MIYMKVFQQHGLLLFSWSLIFSNFFFFLFFGLIDVISTFTLAYIVKHSLNRRSFSAAANPFMSLEKTHLLNDDS